MSVDPSPLPPPTAPLKQQQRAHRRQHTQAAPDTQTATTPASICSLPFFAFSSFLLVLLFCFGLAFFSLLSCSFPWSVPCFSVDMMCPLLEPGSCMGFSWAILIQPAPFPSVTQSPKY